MSATTRTVLPLDSWRVVREMLQREPAGTILRVPKVKLPHPLDAGAEVSTSLAVGQSADYRWRHANGVRLHAREFPTYYEVQYEKLAASETARPAVASSESLAVAAGLTAFGALVGGLLGRSRASTFLGGGIGAVIGSLVLADADKSEDGHADNSESTTAQ
jgi:hypothetical protein